MRRLLLYTSVTFLLIACSAETYATPTAEESMKMLVAGNERFAAGKMTHPNTDKARLDLAATKNQGNYAYATIVSCSDSRVPVEFIFDSGIMDLFVIRIAGNVCDTDEIGSVEYGTRHVNTPVLMVLGHTQCGAVTAVCKELTGHGHPLEKNIPQLVDNIIPAVKKVQSAFPQASAENLITRSIDENVWQGIESIFLRSAAVRELAKSGKLKVVGAIYELETGKVKWLSDAKVAELLKKADEDPAREKEAMAGGGGHSEVIAVPEVKPTEKVQHEVKDSHKDQKH